MPVYTCLSINMSVCHTTSPSMIPSVCQSTHPSVTLSVCDMVSPSVIPVHLSYYQSVHHPVNSSLTHQSVTPPASPMIHSSYDQSIQQPINLSLTRLSVTPTASPVIHPSDCPSLSSHLYTILPCLSDCPPSSDHSSTIFTSPSDCPSLSDSPTATTAHLTACLSSNTIQCTQDSSQSLAVVNGEQFRKAKKFHRAFTNYDLLPRALDVSSIYPSDSRHVAPPKSGEDAHVTCGRCDLGGHTLN